MLTGDDIDHPGVETASPEEGRVSPITHNYSNSAETSEPPVSDSAPNSAVEEDAIVSDVEKECRKLEEAIEKACEEEDYDRAGENKLEPDQDQ